MNSQQRVNLMFSRSGLTKTNFAKKVDLSLNHVVAAVKGTSTIGVESLRKIAKAHPEYNSDWVVSGYGPMLTDGTPEPSVANSVAQNTEVEEGKTVSIVAYLQNKVDQLMEEKAQMLQIILNLTNPSGKLNLQSEAGYSNVVKFIPELASVA